MAAIQWFMQISLIAKAGLVILAIGIIGQVLVPIRGIRMLIHPEYRPENVRLWVAFFIGVLKMMCWGTIQIIGLLITSYAVGYF